MKLLSILLLASILPVSCAWAGRVLSDPTTWKGVSADASIQFEGGPTAKWDYLAFPWLDITQIPHDWSGYNALGVALYVEKDAPSEITIKLASQDTNSKEETFFYVHIPVKWNGWKGLVIPFNEFTCQHPVGWNKIDSLSFHASDKSDKANAGHTIRISSLQLTNIDTPFISDAELINMLNLDYPGMEKVKSAAQSGDIAAAKHEFAEYLRNRTKPIWNLDPHSRPKHNSRPAGVNTTEADRILQRDLPSVHVYHKFEGQIDWNLDPMNYKEWPWQLNRHDFWSTLGRAYWDTGDEEYAREFVYQMTDWVTHCSVPEYTSGNSTGTWRTIEAGIRTSNSWIESYHRFLTSPSFTDDAIILMVKSFAEHARHLMGWPTSGNWLTMETDGLMHIGVLFPEFKEAANWRKTASQRLYAELDKQVYPDGAQVELAAGYHGVALGNFLKAWDIANMNNVLMPEGYIGKIEKMYDYYLKTSMPNGQVPGLNDSDCVDARRPLSDALKRFPGRRDFEWIATKGEKGQMPNFTSIAMPFAGHMIMRSGWNPDDLYLLLDAGPFGYGHQHEDKLSFVAYAYGKYMLVEGGVYPYDSSQWRAYVLSTRAHNTIRVDKQDQHRRTGALQKEFVVSKPLPNKWITTNNFDYASGSYVDGYGPKNDIKITHTRNIFFVKPEYWIVTDFLKPHDEAKHSYESLFHLDAESAKMDELTKAAITQDLKSANMAIAPITEPGLSARIIKGQEKPEVQGWKHGNSYYEVLPIPTAVFEKEASGPTSFGYAFYPIPAGKTNPITRVDNLDVSAPASAQAIGMAIKFSDGRVDYYVQTDKPGAKVQFLNFETDAQAAYIRVENNNIVKALMAGGTRLMKDGKPLQAEITTITDLSETKEKHEL